MNTFVKVNNVLYPASITGRMHDSEWDNRPSKDIKVEMNYEQAKTIFVDDVVWSIVQEREETYEEVIEEIVESSEEEMIDPEVTPEDMENGESAELVESAESKEPQIIYTTVTKTRIVTDEYDNSEYSIAGDITDHRNGYVSVKMGQPTAEEILAILEEVM